MLNRRFHVKARDMVILSQYRAQCAEITKQLHLKGQDETDVSTVIASQGKAHSKIRSPARAETDWIFYPEVPESPRPQATGLQGRKPNQFLYRRDFFILFHHLNFL